MATLNQRQISRAKSEAETSLASANTLYEQWLAAIEHNPTGLAQKDIDQLTKAFKNRLLTVKWDCEDLEELVSGAGAVQQSDELREAKIFLVNCKKKISTAMSQLDDFEANKKLLSKHGIATSMTAPKIPDNSECQIDTSTAAITSPSLAPTIIQNPLHDNAQYQRLLDSEHRPLHEINGGADADGRATNNDDAELHFDKSQIESSATIFSNALYEHYETEDYLAKGLNASKVFNNLTRPNTDSDVYVGANENEMILDMLEPEYYNPPSGLLAKAKCNTTLRKLFFDPDRNKYLTTLMLVLSFPILLMLFLVI